MSKPILVVDDSATVRQQIRATLTTAGYSVFEAVDGQDGLEKIDSVKPALVLCDVNMPRLNGLEMLTRLGTDLLATLPVIMLTTEGQPALIRKARDAGARGWIVKPFHPDQLVKAVQRLVV
jgi:two-component system, chemotaxis family, chemotaxis protein CheY